MRARFRSLKIASRIRPAGLEPYPLPIPILGMVAWLPNRQR